MDHPDRLDNLAPQALDLHQAQDRKARLDQLANQDSPVNQEEAMEGNNRARLDHLALPEAPVKMDNLDHLDSLEMRVHMEETLNTALAQLEADLQVHRLAVEVIQADNHTTKEFKEVTNKLEVIVVELFSEAEQQ